MQQTGRCYKQARHRVYHSRSMTVLRQLNRCSMDFGYFTFQCAIPFDCRLCRAAHICLCYEVLIEALVLPLAFLVLSMLLV